MAKLNYIKINHGYIYYAKLTMVKLIMAKLC
jgi:hypothetical protein